MALVALGITGGIAAYKAVEIARGLQKRGHSVVAVMTRSACHFVGPLTFEAITGRRVVTDQFETGVNTSIEHVQIASSIGLLLVAPATANIIGKFANGIADDFLSSLYLATRSPVLVAPAMNSVMWEHPAVQQNMSVLFSRGVGVVPPGEGFLACGWMGKGRMAEPAQIVAAAERLLGRTGPLLGLRLLVTAGPTYEDLDPVRFIGNRSSGRMGFAIADEAARRGAHVMLVTGPSHLEPPAVAEVIRVRSAGEMHEAVMARAQAADAVIMAAAVADYAPDRIEAQKITKQPGPLTLTLRRTPDILAELGERRQAAGTSRPILVGFAAETSELISRARAKRERKHLDVIVANDVSREGVGFEADTNAVTLITAEGEEEIGLRPKTQVAAAILDRLERLLEPRP